MFKTIAKDMFLSVLAYQNQIYNQTVCSWHEMDGGFLQLQTTLGNAASKSDISYAGLGLYP